MPQADVPAGAPPVAVRLARAGGALAVLEAWCMLALVDLVLAGFGFGRLLRAIESWPTRRVRRGAGRDAMALCDNVRRARAYYFKRAWCLQSAAVAVCLLRLNGIPAEFVIGVRRVPFSAHAWVQVNGEVVLNNRDRLASTYRVIARR